MFVKRLNASFVLIFHLFISGSLALSCLDMHGTEVDWYVTSKVPRIRKSNISMVQDGTAHFYMDLNIPQWTLSKIPVNVTGNAISDTLQQIYSDKTQKILYFMYNDERAKQNQSNYPSGHTKGVVAFDSDSGFWLIHSVPKFPPPKSSGFSYPHTGLRYGQSFMCISFPYKQLGQIAIQLKYNQPNIYDQFIPPQMSKDFPILKTLSIAVKGPPWFHVATLVSKVGQKFTSFAKSSKFNKDLYADLIAPSLKSDILVESWMDGSGSKLHSNCSISYKVYDVKFITLPYGISFSEKEDHSKWATSWTRSQNLSSSSAKTTHTRQTEYWTCVGDINRKSPQERKGGGSVCINNEKVWTSYRNSVKEYEPC